MMCKIWSRHNTPGHNMEKRRTNKPNRKGVSPTRKADVFMQVYKNYVDSINYVYFFNNDDKIRLHKITRID